MGWYQALGAIITSEEIMSEASRKGKENIRFIPTSGPLIIDTDAGIDDATAMFVLFKYDRFQVEAITCVRGSTNVYNAAINVQKVLNVANKTEVSTHDYINREINIKLKIP